VGIFEKAYTFFRGGGTYDGIDHGSGRNGFDAFGLTSAGNIFAAGNGTQTLLNIRAALNSGKIVTLETQDPAITGGAPLVSDHLYVVDRVNTTQIFVPLVGLVDVVSSVTLRFDGAGNDGNNDGLVTVTAAQVQANCLSADAAWA
jgi:hypothetical protein